MSSFINLRPLVSPCGSTAESSIVYLDPAIKSQDDSAIKVFHFTPTGAASAAKHILPPFISKERMRPFCHFEGAEATEKSYKISHIRSK
jgi:hypothetical protein